MSRPWIADRMSRIDASGIRKVFDLAAKMKDPINLSIGQPHFDTPEPIKQALYRAVAEGRNAYSQTQGIAPLLEKLQRRVDAEYGHRDRKLFVSSGTSGGLMLALSVLVNPGDEVIYLRSLLRDVQAPDDAGRRQAGPRRHVSRFPHRSRQGALGHHRADEGDPLQQPGQPDGTVLLDDELEGLARLAAEKDIALVSDEIYRTFCYDRPFASPARWNERTIVIDGFSKSHSMTGWRLGYVHGPEEIMQQMIKLQQFTFVCAAAGAVGRRGGLRRRGSRTRGRIPPQPRFSAARAGRACTSSPRPTGPFISSPRPPGERGANSSPRRSATTCSSSPATSSATATRISAFPTRPSIARSNGASKCYESSPALGSQRRRVPARQVTSRAGVPADQAAIAKPTPARRQAAIHS